MKVYGVFYGGRGYSYQYLTNEDVEEFRSMKHAAEEFWSRTDFDPYYPNTDESAEMHLFFKDPRSENPADFLDLGYPDKIIKLGPKGGVRIENV